MGKLTLLGILIFFSIVLIIAFSEVIITIYTQSKIYNKSREIYLPTKEEIKDEKED